MGIKSRLVEGSDNLASCFVDPEQRLKFESPGLKENEGWLAVNKAKTVQEAAVRLRGCRVRLIRNRNAQFSLPVMFIVSVKRNQRGFPRNPRL